jgi:subfamily B ATP-binding cassette protein MsbA
MILSNELKQVYRRLLRYVRPYLKVLIVASLASMVSGALSGAPVLLVERVFNDVFRSPNEAILALIPVLIILIYFFKGVFFYLQTYLMERVGQSIVRDIRTDLFRHTVFLPLGFFTRTPTGVLMSRITNDVSQLQLGVTKVLTEAVQQIFVLLFLVGYLFTISWKLAFLSFVIVPATLLPLRKFARRLRRASRHSQERMADISNSMFETYYGIHIVKAFNMEGKAIDKFKRHNQRYWKAMLRARQVDAILPSLMEFIGAVAAAGIIYFGGRLALANRLDEGTLFAFIVGLFMLYRPIKKLGGLNYHVQKATAAGLRIFEILEQTNPIHDAEDAIELQGFEREIAFHDVCFEYGDTPILEGITFTARKGEIIAIVGASGAGKTTLVNLIPRFYDVTRGAITIDGVDIRRFTLHSLRTLIGIVSQETILFNDTVHENIAYGQQDVPRERVEEAARLAFADGFIRQLPEGYDSLIRERGANLSGGEKQRLAIARALLKNPPILILDEATSALDTESEAEIQRALDNLMKNRTTFVIAHRLSTIRNADRILVLKGGRIVESGTHDELIALNREYKKLHDLQFKQSSPPAPVTAESTPGPGAKSTAD